MRDRKIAVLLVLREKKQAKAFGLLELFGSTENAKKRAHLKPIKVSSLLK